MYPISRANLNRILRRDFRMLFGATIVLLSLAFLGYFVYRNWGTLTAYRWRFNYPQLALTAWFHLCAFLIAVSGWHSIVSRLASANDLLLNARIYCYSTVAARLPGVAWDIATRVAMYDQAGVSKAVVGVASLLELGIIVLAGVVLYIALTPLTLPHLSRLGTWPLVIALACSVVLTNPRLIRAVIRKVKKGAPPAPLTYRETAQWLLTYQLVWLTGGLVLYATVRSIYDLPLRYVLQVVADWTLSGVLTSFITFVPSSLGLKEVTLTLLLSRYMPEHIAVVTAILMRLLTTGYSIMWTLCSTRLAGSPEREH